MIRILKKATGIGLLLAGTLVARTGFAVDIPAIAISPTSLSVTIPQDTNQTRALTIQSVGSAPLDWSVVEGSGNCFITINDIPWISVSPDAGTTSAGNSTVLDVVFDSTGMLPGSYSGNLCVPNNTGDTFPIVPVSLTVELLNNPPECDQASPSAMILWPPNHGLSDVQILGVTDPDGHPVTITIDQIWQDETVDDNGNGKFAPDGFGVGTSTATVRGERAGRSNGRVYHINFSAEDGFGGICTGGVMVSVPRDRSGAPAVDEGPLFDSTATSP